MTGRYAETRPGRTGHREAARVDGTTPSWATYRTSIGDRSGLFALLADAWAPASALYPGSYLDLSPSTAIHTVTYVDTDRRAARFFADRALVTAELEGRTRAGAGVEVRFLHADYTAPLPVAESGCDLLISLFSGLVWDACQHHLAQGGLLLANTSHGDASVAALDPRLRLVAAVHHRNERFRLDREDLDTYLVPKKPAAAEAELIRASGRGIAYSRSAFAYVFQRAAD